MAILLLLFGISLGYVGLSGLIGGAFVIGWRDGSITFRRDERPAAYWFSVVVSLFFGLALLGVAAVTAFGRS